jgi:hypothetical protein
MTEPTRAGNRSTEQSSQVCDRRGLLRRAGLAAGIGVAGSAVGQLVAGQPASAATGDPVLQGTTNVCGPNTTVLTATTVDVFSVAGVANAVLGTTASTSGGAGVRGVANAGGGIGVRGVANAAAATGVWAENTAGGLAMYGQSDEAAIQGYTNSSIGHAAVQGFAANAGGLAMFGFSPTTAIEGQTTGTAGDAGVYGLASSAGGRGVVGASPSVGVYGTATGGTGTGVQGASASGVGVDGTATSGTAVRGTVSGAGGIGVVATAPAGATALQVTGTARFSRSGRATVPAGKTSVTVPGVVLSSGSLVLATLQHAAKGNGVSSAVPKPGSSSIVITLLRAPVVPLPVAWFVVN